MSNTNYPGEIDTPVDPKTTDFMNVVSHAAQHDFANDAIVALQTMLVGIGTDPPHYSPARGCPLLRRWRQAQTPYRLDELPSEVRLAVHNHVLSAECLARGRDAVVASAVPNVDVVEHDAAGP